jgi:threonine synthase
MSPNVYFVGTRCTGCGASFPPDTDILLCPDCESLVDPVYDLERFRTELPGLELDRRPPSIWKWRELLPVSDFEKIVTLGEGGAPLIACPGLARTLGVRALYVLDDGSSMPTGSLKDRSIAVAATKAVEFGYHALSCDSTGNKGASTAAYAARAGLRSIVFCPWDTPLPKMAQALFYGARVVRVRGHFSEVNAMYRRLLRVDTQGKSPWYDCGTDNPFRYEGKKSYAYEIAEALDGVAPTRVFHPAAGCMSLVKMQKGFEEMLQLERIDRMPALYACQSEACAPIVKAWESGAATVEGVEKGATVASALAFADPGLLGNATLATLRATSGGAVSVGDDELLAAWKELGRSGIFCEPSAAISLAAAQRLAESGELDSDDVLVCNVTGSGFKDMETLLKNVVVPETIVESYDELRALVREL